MNKPHKHRDVIIAWANGEIVQRQDEQGWFDWYASIGGIPNFDFGNWRIKPKITKKEGWVNVYSAQGYTNLAGVISSAYQTKECADHEADSNRVACIRIEWEEEQ